MTPRRPRATSRASILGTACALQFLAMAIPDALHAQKDAARPSTEPPPRQRASWFADRRDFVVGDVITILMDEQTLAEASKYQTGSDEQSRDLGLGIDPPKIGETALPTIDMSVGTDKRAQSRQRGDASRDVRFVGTMTVRVVAFGPGGLLQVQGKRVVDVDRNKQEMTLTGWVRPQDVDAQNVVQSPRIADAQIVYKLGGLGKTRGGIIGKIIGAFWP